jgi:hypothetical protein
MMAGLSPLVVVPAEQFPEQQSSSARHTFPAAPLRNEHVAVSDRLTINRPLFVVGCCRCRCCEMTVESVVSGRNTCIRGFRGLRFRSG